MGCQTNSSKILNLTITVVAILLGTTIAQIYDTSRVFAQTEQPKPNPLEITTPDPLLPQIERPLSPLERFRLKQTLEEFNNQANAQLKAGNEDEAFNIWYREIRIWRAFGPLEEVEALGRVAGVAWDKSRKADVEIITDRLEAIEQKAQAQAELDPILLAALGKAYEQLRNPEKALVIYQQILANAREGGDIEAQEEALNTIGQLHLAWFDYPNAATTYEELLVLARSQLDFFGETVYLRQLSYIYNEAVQPENSLRIKKQIGENYLKNQQLEQLAELKISMGSDYEALDKPEDASQYYQEAFTMAWGLKQLAVAGDALEKLGNLYRNYDQNAYALQIYQELLKVEQQSYDFFGLMNTYDRIAKIYLEEKDYPHALEAFEKALELARSLKYQETYFSNQIEQVNEQIVPAP
ncbi:MAG: tetratricopeptide repeat protein [Moorea sp. SIO2B7]|nr:tetratricopeptide repeat protein [Moorena sp. SIO2B7]